MQSSVRKGVHSPSPLWLVPDHTVITDPSVIWGCSPTPPQSCPKCGSFNNHHKDSSVSPYYRLSAHRPSTKLASFLPNERFQP